ncbi:hypothetical protein TI05_00300 [Achromatium sp. WMS3]|nr:hypothetical protein TI05_00300 [Achromatium sp. WMS3]
MKNALQEQLLKHGLVNKSKAQQVRKEQRKQAKNSSNQTKELVAKSMAEKVARDRELNRQKELKQTAKAHKILIKQFIEQHRLNEPHADQVYNFTHDSNIKRIYVTSNQKDRLIKSKLAIVYWQDRYSLIEVEAANKIRELSKEIFIFIAPPQDQTADEEYYADFQIPDDLMW